MIINTPIVTVDNQLGYFKQTKVLSEGRYPLSSNIVQSATNPDVLVIIFSDWVLGHTWREQNQVSMIKSTDCGRTWSAKSVIYNPGAGYGAMDTSAGVDQDTGRIYFQTNMYQGTGTTISGTKYFMLGHSDNDGTSWTMTDISSILPDTLPFASRGKFIKQNGVLMFPWYNVEPDFSPSNRFLARMVSGVWSRVLMEGPTVDYLNETDIINKDDTIIGVTRSEVTLEFVQYKSVNNGVNWTNQGALTFGESWTGAAPAYLTSFLLDGIEVWVAYITDRPNRKLMAVYGLPDNIIAGTSGWNVSTKLTLYIPGTSAASASLYHYGSVVHPYNDLRAIGTYAYDKLGWGLTSTNQLHVFDLPATHKAALKAQLGI